MTDLSMIGVDYRRIGPTPLAVWEAEYLRVNSPLLPFARAMWRMAGEHSSLCLAQQWIENQYGTQGIIIQPEDYNPLSSRPWIGDPTATVQGEVVHWQTRQRVGTITDKDGTVLVEDGVMPVPPGAIGAVYHPEGGFFLRFSDPINAVREWRRRIVDDPGYKGGVYTTRRTLRQMIDTYAPPGDTHPETGLDNKNTKYVEVVTERLTAFAQMEGQQPPEENPAMDRPYIIVSGGHRYTTQDSNPVEREMTDELARDYTAALRKAGYEADWVQRDLDGDALGDLTSGDFASVVNVVRRVIAKRIVTHPNQLMVYVELHYDGAHSPLHVIVPDNRGGLNSTYGDGWVVSDTAANNTLDVELAKATAQEIGKATGLPLRAGGAIKVAGIMSETESGVANGVGTGGVKYRLGMFSGTAVYRNAAVRIVIEHGGTDDAPVQKGDFTNTAAQAFVAAVSATFGITATPPVVIDPPDVEPEKPSTVTYPARLSRAIATELFGQVTGSDDRVYGYDERGPVSKRWLALGRATGQYPELVKAFIDGGVKYFTFSNGTLIVDDRGTISVVESEAA